MSKTFEDYCQELQREVDAIAQQAEADARLDHLHAFNFGRSLGHMEVTRDHFRQRARWLLLGAAVGVAFAAVYLQVYLSARILEFAR